MHKKTGVNYFSEDIDFAVQNPIQITQWVFHVSQAEEREVSQVNYIFCSDNYLKDVNIKFLNHDYYTDIITFANSSDPIEADIFISIDRVKENSLQFNQSFDDELHRVMIHGILHLVGYGDKTEAEKTLMREKENIYLELFPKNT